VILAWPTLVFCLISVRYLSDPVRAASEVGIAFVSPLGLTIARVGFGGFPLACGLFALWCLISTRRILTGLSFATTVISVALVVRVVGMLADGTSRQNLKLVVAEIVMITLLAAGLVLETSRNRRLRASVA